MRASIHDELGDVAQAIYPTWADFKIGAGR
jgi:hypothetical protein